MTPSSLSRRGALAGLAGTVPARNALAQERTVRWSSGTETPRTIAPPGATDCHLHTFDRRYPAVAGATLLPEDATPADHRVLQRRQGTSRGVLVQPSTYGTGNRLQIASRQALGPENFR